MNGGPSLDSVRVVVAFGYHGDAFHGSQVQPGIRTVEGSLRRALERLGWWSEGCLEMSSRTDAGVSVRMNLARIDLPSSVSESIEGGNLLRAVNNNLPIGIVVWKARMVPRGTRIRHSYSRHYLYRTEVISDWPQEVDVNLLSEACSLLEGHHDFTNLCRLEEGKDPVRTIDECEPWLSSDGRVIGISVKSQAFLWNQVRRIASAVSGVASGRNTLDDIRSALEKPEVPLDLGRAPSDGLMLWSIENEESEGMTDGAMPDTSWFSLPPRDSREHTRWLALARLEMATLLEREWLKRLN